MGASKLGMVGLSKADLPNFFKVLQEGQSLSAGLLNSVKLIGEGLMSGAKNMMTVGMACAAAGIIVGIVGMCLGA